MVLGTTGAAEVARSKAYLEFGLIMPTLLRVVMECDGFVGVSVGSLSFSNEVVGRVGGDVELGRAGAGGVETGWVPRRDRVMGLN